MLDMLASTGLALAQTGANIYMQRKTNQANSAEAERNRQFQSQQSNTTYSRAAADMRNAGLNPLLAGGGATSPAASGSTAQHGSAQVGDFSSLPFSASSIDIERRRQSDAEKTAQDQRDLLKLQKETEANNATKAKYDANISYETDYALRNQNRADQAQGLYTSRAQAEKASLRASTQQSNFAEKQASFENKHSSTLVPINTVSGVAGSILSPAHSAKQLFTPIRRPQR